MLGGGGAGENGRAAGGEGRGPPAPCLHSFCLAEQTAVGKRRREWRSHEGGAMRDEGSHEGSHEGGHEGSAGLGGLDARGTQGAPPTPLPPFCFVLSEWGQLFLSGVLSTLRLYRNSLPPHPTHTHTSSVPTSLPQSVIHKPSLHHQ